MIRHAFEMFATGTIKKQEILDHLNAGPDHREGAADEPPDLRTASWSTPSTAARGGVEEWDINQHGTFEPIVEKATFERVQELLLGQGPTVTLYLRLNPDFPLRRFVRCGACGKPLIASWSSGNGGRYGYYFCQRPECKVVTVGKEPLATALVEHLQRLQPRRELTALFGTVVIDVWRAKRANVEAARATAAPQRAERPAEPARRAIDVQQAH